MKRIASSLRALSAAALLSAGLDGLAAAQDVDATVMVGGGLQVVQMVDQNKTGELWDGAAPATKARVKRPDFANQITQLRGPLGAPQQRTWVAINRQVLADADADLAGQYVSVEYETRFANAPTRTVREMASFHLDRDGVWRFSGYVLR